MKDNSARPKKAATQDHEEQTEEAEETEGDVLEGEIVEEVPPPTDRNNRRPRSK